MSGEPDEAATPAERRLAEHLELLRAQGPEPDHGLARGIVRSARWQGALRGPLRVAGMIASSVGAALEALLGTRGERR